MPNLQFHLATETDLDLLAQWNLQLIRDEGSRNPMTIPQLRDRMQNWLAGEYHAVIFTADSQPVAYALYRENEKEIYLRQLFVSPDRRRQGIGHQAVNLLRTQLWPKNKRLTVEVLTNNTPAVDFWRAIGYRDYSLTLEITPPAPKE